MGQPGQRLLTAIEKNMES